MKTALKIAASALTLSALAAPAFAQNSASVTTTGSATIIQPIAISGTNMAFGTLVKPATGSGVVTLSNTGGSVTTSGGVASLASGSKSSAAYSITGEGGQAISVTVPATLTMDGPSSSSLVVTLTNTTLPTALTGSLGAAGTGSFGVGGTFTLGSTQTSGAYTGTFVVQVAYN